MNETLTTGTYLSKQPFIGVSGGHWTDDMQVAQAGLDALQALLLAQVPQM